MSFSVSVMLLMSGGTVIAQEIPSGPRKLTEEPIAPNVPPAQPTPAPSVRNPSLDPKNLVGRRLLAEGSMINGMSGVLFRTAGSDVIFLPDGNDSGKSKSAAAQPFVLIPSQKLAQLESATKAADANLKVTLSGQVYVYRNRQYLLLTAYSIKQASVEPTTEQPQVAPPKSTETQPKETKPELDPRVEDLIRELENERGGERMLDPAPDTDQPAEQTPSGESAAEADGSAERLVAEGTLINSRRGRLIRVKSAGGRLGFALDNDPDSPASPPMLIVPCAMLTNMEAAARTHGDDLSFTMSGRVLVYEGRNHVLPVLYQVRRPSDVKSLQ